MPGPACPQPDTACTSLKSTTKCDRARRRGTAQPVGRASQFDHPHGPILLRGGRLRATGCIDVAVAPRDWPVPLFSSPGGGPADRCVTIGLRTSTTRCRVRPSADEEQTVTLNAQQEELCRQSTWDFSDLQALFINCTLKRSPEQSHTQGLIDIAVGDHGPAGSDGRPDPGRSTATSPPAYGPT